MNGWLDLDDNRFTAKKMRVSRETNDQLGSDCFSISFRGEP